MLPDVLHITVVVTQALANYVCAFRHLDTCTLCPPLQHEVLCLVTYEQLLLNNCKSENNSLYNTSLILLG